MRAWPIFLLIAFAAGCVSKPGSETPSQEAECAFIAGTLIATSIKLDSVVKFESGKEIQIWRSEFEIVIEAPEKYAGLRVRFTKEEREPFSDEEMIGKKVRLVLPRSWLKRLTVELPVDDAWLEELPNQRPNGTPVKSPPSNPNLVPVVPHP